MDFVYFNPRHFFRWKWNTDYRAMTFSNMYVLKASERFKGRGEGSVLKKNFFKGPTFWTFEKCKKCNFVI